MISLALTTLFFTGIALLNFIVVNVLRVLTAKYNLLSKIKNKEQKIALVLLHLCYMTLISCVSLWIVIVGWYKSDGTSTIEHSDIYIIVLQVGIAYYVHDILALTTGTHKLGTDSARLIHHYIAICGYIGVLEEPKGMFYSATMSVELYKLPLVIMQLLYYFELTDHWFYIAVRSTRFILWSLIKTSSIAINITVSIIHGLPDLTTWYYAILLSTSSAMAWYNLYVIYSDVKYFYGLIRSKH